ncbi:MAG: mechanosensitive ion channel family protein [Steroidobacteraceae bacterium]|jgi:small-conductance mechanosensitive channel|nr:mechanosensitive ion channel family protein [Steroidobacteraceae bacterium]
MSFELRACAALLAGLFLFAADTPMARAAEPSEAQELHGEVEPPATATVELAGRVILRVRGVAGYPAPERAAAVNKRLHEFAENRAVAPESVELVEVPRGTALQAGTVMLVTITDADAALEGLPRAQLAGLARNLLVEAVTKWRAERAPAYLLRQAAWLAGATVLLVLALWPLARLRRWAAERFAERSAAAVRLRKVEFLQAESARQLVQALVRLAFWLLVFAIIYYYLQYALRLFPWTRPLGERLLELFVDPLRTLGLGAVESLPSLLFLLVLAIVTRYLLGMIHAFFVAVEQGRIKLSDFDSEWAMTTYKLVRVFVLAFALVVAYPYIPGSDSAAFKGVSVLLGVLISIGSSSMISSIVAGYTMTYRRTFRNGDRIRVGDVYGDVVDSRLMVTTVRTPKNELVIVPNSEILAKSVVNYTALARERGLILHTTVGIGYETPWRQVEAMLLMAAERTPGLAPEPAPFVLQTSLGDFAVNYQLNAYVHQTKGLNRLYSELHKNIQDVFNEYGVQIMTPAYVADPTPPKVVPPESWYLAPAAPRPEPARTEPGA